MSGVTRAVGILALLTLAAGVGLLILTAGDGLVTGERGPRLGALVHGNLATAVLMTTAGVLLALGAATRRTRVVLAAAALLLGGAAVHLIGIAASSDLLGASGSTVAAFLGLGGAALVIGATPESP